MLEKLTDADLTLDTCTTVIRPVKSVRDLGVHLDSEFRMKIHISKVVSSCYHQIDSQNSSDSPARRARCHSTAGFSIHFIATPLLQLTVVSYARVNYSASAACHECSGSSHHELVVARPREISAEAPTFRASHFLRTNAHRTLGRTPEKIMLPALNSGRCIKRKPSRCKESSHTFLYKHGHFN